MSKYKEKLLEEIQDIPEVMMPKLYRIVHLFFTEVVHKKKPAKRGSLKGIWKGSHIDETLFSQAKKSLFSYEYK